MPNPVILKLEHYTRLSFHDKQAIDRACSVRVRRFGPRDVVRYEGDQAEHVIVLLEGWACRYKGLEDGRRQIVSYFVPGDFCDLKAFILKHADHTIAALSDVKLAEVPIDVIEELTTSRSRLARSLWWASLVAEAIEREWIVNIGQRDAVERLGHLFCELFYRLHSVGLTSGDTYNLPVTQAELAETTGMSAVHVNRSLQELRNSGLIILNGRTLSVPDLSKLEQAVLFNPSYLHLGREGAAFDANDF